MEHVKVSILGFENLDKELIATTISSYYHSISFQKEETFTVYKQALKLWDNRCNQFDIAHFNTHDAYNRAGYSLYSGNVIFIIPFRLDDQEQIEHVRRWQTEIERYSSVKVNAPILIIGISVNQDMNIITVDEAKQRFGDIPCFILKSNFIDNEKDQFKIDITNFIDLFILYYNFRISNIFPNSKKLEQKVNENENSNNNNINNNNNNLDLFNIYPFCNRIDEFKNQQERDQYELNFFTVFRNKIIFNTIFKKVNYINSKYNIKVFKVSTSTPRTLLSNGFDKELYQRLLNDPNNIFNEFSYLDTQWLLRTKNIDFELFKLVYERYKDRFDYTKQRKYLKLDTFEHVSILSLLENSIIGGNFQIIQFILNSDISKSQQNHMSNLNSFSLSIASLLNNNNNNNNNNISDQDELIIVKYLFQEFKFSEILATDNESKEMYTFISTLSKQFNNNNNSYMWNKIDRYLSDLTKSQHSNLSKIKKFFGFMK